MSSILADADRFAELLTDLGHTSAGVELAERERADLLLSLHPKLLRATELGRQKLERFRAERPKVPETYEEIRAIVSFYGDASVLDLVSESLAIVPACVRHHALDVCAFLGVGKDSVAWTSSLRFVSADGKQRHRVIVLGPDAGTRTVCHETAHVWHGAPIDDETSLSVAISVQGEEGFRVFMAEQGDRGKMEAHISMHERLADACADVWLESSRG